MVVEKMNNPLPKKSLGQHWLNDSTSLDAICEMADLKVSDTVLEVGPGLGSLTEKLVTKVEQVIAIELDENLARLLPLKVRADNLTVHQEDILHYNLTKLPKGYKVVANIPYYLTSKLIRVLCESINPPSLVVLLVQKEVAQRVCAKSGNMSILSVSAQFYCQVDLGPIVSAKLFSPPPKVDSQILRLKHYDNPLFPDVESKLFFRVVKAGFSNRRKTLSNSLSAGLHIAKTEVVEIIQNADLSPTTRPQELRLVDWHNLYLSLAKSEASGQ